MFLKSDMCTSEHIQEHLLKLHFQIVSQNCWSQSSAPFLAFVLYPRGNGEGVTEFVCLFVFLSSFWMTIRLQWWIHIFQTGWGCQPQTYLLAFFPKHCMKLKKKKNVTKREVMHSYSLPPDPPRTINWSEPIDSSVWWNALCSLCNTTRLDHVFGCVTMDTMLITLKSERVLWHHMHKSKTFIS